MKEERLYPDEDNQLWTNLSFKKIKKVKVEI